MKSDELSERIERLEEGQRRLIGLLTTSRTHCGENDASAAGGKCRAALELLCLDVLSRFHPGYNIGGQNQLDRMMAELANAVRIPPAVREAMRAVQHFGNCLVHEHGASRDPGMDAMMAHAALFSLSVVVQWYFNEFQREAGFHVADLVNGPNSRVVQVELTWTWDSANAHVAREAERRSRALKARETARTADEFDDFVPPRVRKPLAGTHDRLSLEATIRNVSRTTIDELDLAVNQTAPSPASGLWRVRLPSAPTELLGIGIGVLPARRVLRDNRLPLHPGQSVVLHKHFELAAGTKEAVFSWNVYLKDCPPTSGEWRLQGPVDTVEEPET
jgi:hypothetical protein